MSEVEAVVVSVEGDVVVIETGPRASGCGRCNEPGGCGGSLLNLKTNAATRRYRVDNSIKARSGDRVLLCAPEGAVLKAALITYGIPLLLMLAGAAAGMWFDGSDAAALTGAVAGLAMAVASLRSRMAKRWEPNLSLRFKAVDSCFQRTLIT